jgi:dTDP-4-dehydrorhamnose 3,5-epimerase
MEVVETGLEGVVLITPKVFTDARGFFLESYNARVFADAGLPDSFVQDNHSFSVKGVLRGLHYQYPTWQGKLVRAVHGAIFDVAVDIRRGSSTFGQWYGATLSADNKQMLYIPPGYAHGFCVVSDNADVVYKCTTPYVPADDGGVLWNDPDIGIQWPISDPLLSEKDAKAPRLRDLALD